MNFIARLMFFLCAGIMLAGCTTVTELPAQVNPAEPATAEYRKAKALLVAFMQNDPGKFVSLLPEDKQSAFDANRFRTYRFSIVDSLGEPKSFSYVTQLNMPVFYPYVWKVTFERIDKEGKTLQGEALFRVIAGKTGDEVLIVSFQFL